MNALQDLQDELFKFKHDMSLLSLDDLYDIRINLGAEKHKIDERIKILCNLISSMELILRRQRILPEFEDEK